MKLHAENTEYVGQVKDFFETAHRKLGETTDLTVKNAGIHHANMVRDVVVGLQEILQKGQAPIDILLTILEPQEHVTNSEQTIQQ